MALTLNWNQIPDAKEYHIYRSKQKFAIGSLPTDKVVVPAGSGSYQYTDVDRQNIYWFVIKTVDQNGGEVFGQVFSLGYWPESGPGPSQLLRGDWDFGFFGEVNSSLIATNFTDITGALLNVPTVSKAPWGAGTITAFLKVIVNGKILFIPKEHPTSANLARTQQNYIDNGLSGPAYDPATAPQITLKGNDFIHRLCLASISKPITATLDVLSDDVLKSELGMFLALGDTPASGYMTRNPTQTNDAPAYMRLGDYADFSQVFSLHSTQPDNTGYLSGMRIAPASGVMADGYLPGSQVNLHHPVLELLF